MRRGTLGGLVRRLPRTTRVLAFLGIVILALPTAIILVASLTKGNDIVFPPHGLTLHWYGKLFTDSTIHNGLLHSLYIAAVAVVVDTVAGVLAAFGLGRCGAEPGWRGSSSRWGS